MSVLKRVRLLPEAEAELKALEDIDLQKAVLEALLLIEGDLEYGRLLERNDATGDLRGCRKVYVDKATDGKPRYRLVYWLAPSEANPRRAQVLAIGERRGLEAYALAAGRYNADRAAFAQPPVEEATDEQLGLSG